MENKHEMRAYAYAHEAWPRNTIQLSQTRKENKNADSAAHCEKRCETNMERPTCVLIFIILLCVETCADAFCNPTQQYNRQKSKVQRLTKRLGMEGCSIGSQWVLPTVQRQNLLTALIANKTDNSRPLLDVLSTGLNHYIGHIWYT